jgi:putative two-component system response regulator
LIGGALGLARDEVELIRRAAPLHDLGKIGIPDEILLKPGALTDDEFELMRNHTTIGARILSGSRFPHLQFAEDIALTHHERWDGNGYIGLEGDAIPLVGRIVAVADVFDALTHERPYKPAWDEADAVDEIGGQAGRQFDPTVVEAFLALQKVTHLSDPKPEELGPALPSPIDIQEADIEEARSEVLSA